VRDGRVKSRAAWAITLVSACLFGFHYFALWTLAATFASGLTWWANLLLSLGPITALASLVINLRSPRQPAAAVVSGVVVLAYLVIWLPLLSHLSTKPVG
jgi:hypothetical protein